METRAKLKAISKNYETGGWQLVLEIPKLPQSVQKLNGSEVDLDIKKWRDKRSTKANNYFWQLVTELANKLGGTRNEMYMHLLQRYGQLDIVDGVAQWRVLPEGQEPGEKEYLSPTANVVRMGNNKKGEPVYGRLYLKMRGSSSYDTAEMSRLIQGTVEDAQEQGIDTRTPDEIEKMVQMWVPEG